MKGINFIRNHNNCGMYLMQKILVVSYQCPPCASSGVHRFLRFMKVLPVKGWFPVVLTILPEYYPSDVPQDLELGKWLEEKSNIEIIKTKAIPGVDDLTAFFKFPKKNSEKEFNSFSSFSNKKSFSIRKERCGLWRKTKDFVTVSLMVPDKQNRWFFHGLAAARRIVKKHKISLIYAHGGPWTALIIAAFVKTYTGLPLVIDFRDPWTDNPYDELDSIIRKNINRYLEWWCISKSSYVITNTQALKDLFVKKYPNMSSDKFVTITNGYDEEDYSGFFFEKKQDVNKTVSIVHTGSLYSKRSPIPFLSLISELINSGNINKNDVKIYMIGKVELHGLDVFIAKHKLEDVVVFTGLVSKRESIYLTFSADILLLLQQDTKLQIPGKLFEYIRSGKPIFSMCDEGATRDIILDNKLGPVVSPNEIEGAKIQFLELFGHILKAKKEGNEPPYTVNQEIVKSFSSVAQSEELIGVFNKALHG